MDLPLAATLPAEPVTMTTAAAAALAARADPAEPGLALRLYVMSGGCSGFRYGMMLDQPSAEDRHFESQGQAIIVDAASYPLVAGAEIDYLDTLMGAGFTVNNPHAVAACGCGSSFRTADGAGDPGACHH
jgi:iron-sulfur cluster assembly protein